MCRLRRGSARQNAEAAAYICALRDRRSIGSRRGSYLRWQGIERRRAFGVRDALHEGDELFGAADLGFARLARDSAAIEHDETLGDVEDVMNVVTDEKDRPTGSPHRSDKAKNL